ncbi:interleukin-12 receptor subunit beta-2 [Trichechus manatus latirostris]|uniref:Interleukin-12 receptor subunit beta-2 n=1 Tax=Trichechus manatus latirostris TaxID=127582 RepID=A0A2Y9QRT0_TRIMA|nr:interleukin-12 receptor subunit beta-2 [Trichechus manatus latirostris]
MAYTVRGCSLAFICITMWLLIKAKIDVCKRGGVTVKPSHVISLGSAVNISCSLKPKQGCSGYSSSNKLILYKFYRKIHFQQGLTLSSQVTDLPLGTTVFVCKLACSSSDEIRICGAEISVGVVPEQPQNVSCIQKGEHGTVACTWDRGRDTHLYTAYTLQLNGPKNLTWQKQCTDHYCDHLDLGINLKPESPESSYTAMVTAINRLGSSSSFPSIFTFLDIVKPLPPWDIRIKFLNASVRRCTLHWRDEGMVPLNRLKYRSIDGGSWNMVNVTNAKGKHDLLDLKPYTEYEFQIASKLHLHKGIWSDWSESLRTQTPEEEPTGMLDVWYMKQHINYNKQQISLFWKGKPGERDTQPLQRNFRPWHHRKPQVQPNYNTQASSDTKVVALRVVHRPEGIGQKENLVFCMEGLLAPHHVSAHSEGVDNMVVTWKPPGKAVQEYVVEWRELHPEGSTQPPLNWLRSASSSVSALISENIKPYVCYEIHVYALSGDQAGCSSIWGSSKHKAPLNGPHIHAITEEKGGILISWNRIPAQEQMGCILRYRIYWKERDSDSQPQLCEIPYRISQNSHSINSLQPRVTYILWMTALTAAGESPRGNEREFYLQGKANWSAFVAPSICIAVITVSIFSVRYFRQKKPGSHSVPQGKSCKEGEVTQEAEERELRVKEEKGAAAAQSEKVRMCSQPLLPPFSQEKTQLPVERLLTAGHTPEEPETLVINEVIHQVAPAFRHPHRLKWPERQQGVQGHCTSVEDIAPPRALTAETRQLGDLYKMLGGRVPDSKPGNQVSPLTVLPVDFLPTHEGYLPSNIDYLPSHEAAVPDPLEELEPQHISLSVFPSSSLHPLSFSCSEKLTLDQLKMGCGSLML